MKNTELTSHHHKLIFVGYDGLCMKNLSEHAEFGLVSVSFSILVYLSRADDVMNSKTYKSINTHILNSEYQCLVCVADVTPNI